MINQRYGNRKNNKVVRERMQITKLKLNIIQNKKLGVQKLRTQGNSTVQTRVRDVNHEKHKP